MDSDINRDLDRELDELYFNDDIEYVNKRLIEVLKDVETLPDLEIKGIILIILKNLRKNANTGINDCIKTIFSSSKVDLLILRLEHEGYNRKNIFDIIFGEITDGNRRFVAITRNHINSLIPSDPYVHMILKLNQYELIRFFRLNTFDTSKIYTRSNIRCILSHMREKNVSLHAFRESLFSAFGTFAIHDFLENEGESKIDEFFAE